MVRQKLFRLSTFCLAVVVFVVSLIAVLITAVKTPSAETAVSDDSVVYSPTVQAYSDGAVDVTKGSYYVGLHWMGDNKYCTLSDNGTHAEWNFEGPTDTVFLNDNGSMNRMYDFSIDIVSNGCDPDDFELTVPVVFYSRTSDGTDVGNVVKGSVLEYTIDEENFERSLNSIDYLTFDAPKEKNAEDREYVLHLKETGAFNISIPVMVKAYILPKGRTTGTTRSPDKYGFCELTDGDSLKVSVFDKDETYMIDANIHAKLSDLTVSGATGNFSGFSNGRVYEWTPKVGTVYGVSKENFAAETANGYVFFEYQFAIKTSGWTDGRLSAQATVSNDGEVASMVLSGVFGTLYNNDSFEFDKDTMSFDFCYTANRIPGMRDSRFCMLTGCMNGTHDIVYVTVLAKHPESSVNNSGGVGKTTTSCTLDVNLASNHDDSNIEKSVTRTLSNLDDFVSVPTGDAYGGQFVGQTGTSNQLFWMQNGISKIQIAAFAFTGKVTVENSSENDRSFATGMAGVMAYDPLDKKWVELGEGDYRIRDFYANDGLHVGRPIYGPNGAVVTYDDSSYSDEDLDHEIAIQFTRAGDPDKWITVMTTTYRNFNVDFKTLTEVFMKSENDAIRFRFLDVDQEIPLCFNSLGVRIDVLSEGETMQRLLAHVSAAGETKLQYNLIYFTSAVSQSSGDQVVEMAKSNLNDPQRVDVIESMIQRVMPEDCKDGKLPGYSVYSATITSDSFGNGTLLIPTLYGNDGKALSPYYTDAVATDVSAVDWFVASYVAPSDNTGKIWSNLNVSENSVLRAEDAVYRILIPDGMTVASVRPGTCDAIIDSWDSIKSNNFANMYYSSTTNYTQVQNFSAFKTAIDSAVAAKDKFSYNLIENYEGTGHMVLEVHAVTPYDRIDNTALTAKFGCFTVRLEPKYSSLVTSSEDLRLEASGYFMTKDGKVFSDKNLSQDNGSYFLESEVFADVNKDGNSTETIVSKHSFQCSVPYQTLVSGMHLSAFDPVTNMSGSNVVIQPGGEYVYRMSYSQMADTSTNVILFDILEDMDTNSWKGTLKEIDTSDADRQNLSYQIYVSKNALLSQDYVNRGVSEAELLTCGDGWSIYHPGDSLEGVTSVAVGFGDQIFAKDRTDAPSTVTIGLVMQSPDEDSLSKHMTSVNNRAFYSDVLRGAESRTMMTNIVSVTFDEDTMNNLFAQIFLPLTGGSGTVLFMVSGAVVLIIGLSVFAVRKKRSLS